MSFQNLNLHEKILQAIEDSGYSTPTEVQNKVIPLINDGEDICASAQTGTGKTAAFLLPAINYLLSNAEEKRPKHPRVLILVPTRELAMQIETQTKKYTKHLPHIKSLVIVGGIPYNKQAPKLKRPLDILIATPGRLIDFMNQKKVNLSLVKILVLDEADRMLDMGFIDPVTTIAESTDPDRQTLLFSATLNKDVIKFSKQLLIDQKTIELSPQTVQQSHIDQTVYFTDDIHHKNRLLDHILTQESLSYAIIFTSTKRQADRLMDELEDKGFSTGCLHGDMNQRQRTRTIMQMRKGSIKILVATDVAARGIDIPTISHIINFDLPDNAEDYVHRIGRTGRAGATGTALTFTSKKDHHMMARIHKFIGTTITPTVIPGLEPKTSPTDNSQPRSSSRRKSSHDGRRIKSKNHRSSDSEYKQKRSSFSTRSDQEPRYRKRSNDSESDRNHRPSSKNSSSFSTRSDQEPRYRKRSNDSESDRNHKPSSKNSSSFSTRSDQEPRYRKRSNDSESDRNHKPSSKNRSSFSTRSDQEPRYRKRSNDSESDRNHKPSSKNRSSFSKRSDQESTYQKKSKPSINAHKTRKKPEITNRSSKNKPFKKHQHA